LASAVELNGASIGDQSQGERGAVKPG